MMKSLFQSGTAGGLPKLNSKLSSLFQRVTFTYDYTIGATASLNISGSDLSLAGPDGYTMIGILRASAQNANVAVTAIFPQTGNHTAFTIRNNSSSSQTGTFRTDMVYIRSENVIVN